MILYSTLNSDWYFGSTFWIVYEIEITANWSDLIIHWYIHLLRHDKWNLERFLKMFIDMLPIPFVLSLLLFLFSILLLSIFLSNLFILRSRKQKYCPSINVVFRSYDRTIFHGKSSIFHQSSSNDRFQNSMVHISNIPAIVLFETITNTIYEIGFL